MEVKARIRNRHDKDIRLGISRLNLEEGEMSDIVREGVRRVLVERGVMQTEDDMKLFERRSHE
jgi:hypothetical protein